MLGALLGILLQGCNTPLVSVKVTSGPGCPTDDDGVGACMPPMSYSSYASGFWHDEPQVWLPQNTNIKCRVGSNKCKSYAGNCAGQSCVSRIKNVDANNIGDCYCGCPPIPG